MCGLKWVTQGGIPGHTSLPPMCARRLFYISVHVCVHVFPFHCLPRLCGSPMLHTQCTVPWIGVWQIWETVPPDFADSPLLAVLESEVLRLPLLDIVRCNLRFSSAHCLKTSQVAIGGSQAHSEVHKLLLLGPASCNMSFAGAHCLKKTSQVASMRTSTRPEDAGPLGKQSGGRPQVH